MGRDLRDGVAMFRQPVWADEPFTGTALVLYDSDDVIGRRGADRQVLNIVLAINPSDETELTNFFERTVSAYQAGVEGEVGFDEEF
jgi:hypothetical protein